MCDSVVVREFKQGDLDEVLEIERASFDEPYGVEVFRRLLTRPNIFLVAECEGHVAGYILALPEDAILHVISVAVAPRWRRMGFAKKLFEQVLGHAVLLGKRGLLLEVDVYNTSAQRLYYELGFIVTGRIPHYYSNGHDALLMVKQI